MDMYSGDLVIYDQINICKEIKKCNYEEFIKIIEEIKNNITDDSKTFYNKAFGYLFWDNLNNNIIKPAIKKYLDRACVFNNFTAAMDEKIQMINMNNKENVLNHLELNAILDPYISYFVDFTNSKEPDYIYNLVNTIINATFSKKYLKKSISFNINNQLQKITIDKYFNICDDERDIDAIISKFVCWDIVNTLNCYLLTFINMPYISEAKNTLITDIKMFFTRNIKTLYSRSIYLNDAVKSINSEVYENASEEMKYNFLITIFDNIKKMEGIYSDNTFDNLKKILVELTTDKKIKDESKELLTSCLKELVVNSDNQLLSAYNFNIVDDLKEIMYTRGSICHPDFLVNIKRFN